MHAAARTCKAANQQHLPRCGPLQGVVALLFCGIDVAATGVLLALRDTAYVAQAMATSMGLLGVFLWWARQQAAVSLHTVWWGLVVFFGLRALWSAPRMVWGLLCPLPPAATPAQG